MAAETLIVVQARTEREDLCPARVGAPQRRERGRDGSEGSTCVGAGIVLTVDGLFRRSRLFRSRELGGARWAISHTRATFGREGASRPVSRGNGPTNRGVQHTAVLVGSSGPKRNLLGSLQFEPERVARPTQAGRFREFQGFEVLASLGPTVDLAPIVPPMTRMRRHAVQTCASSRITLAAERSSRIDYCAHCTLKSVA